MSKEHVGHADLVRFAEERVNLPKEKADEYRSQAQRLTDRLEVYLKEHPDFSLKRLILSGSLAKGTALRSLSDVDVAVYIIACSETHAAVLPVKVFSVHPTQGCCTTSLLVFRYFVDAQNRSTARLVILHFTRRCFHISPGFALIVFWRRF